MASEGGMLGLSLPAWGLGPEKFVKEVQASLDSDMQDHIDQVLPSDVHSLACSSGKLTFLEAALVNPKRAEASAVTSVRPHGLGELPTDFISFDS